MERGEGVGEGETGMGRRREGGAGSGYSSNLISFWCEAEIMKWEMFN